jgi:hypothetical protein
MEISALIKSLLLEGQLLAAAAEEAGPDAAVPTCPPWQVRHLLRHTGTVHRWATAFVVEGHTEHRDGAGEPDLDGAGESQRRQPRDVRAVLPVREAAQPRRPALRPRRHAP